MECVIKTYWSKIKLTNVMLVKKTQQDLISREISTYGPCSILNK